MGDTTKIQWADCTFSPWRICTPVSPGCANCYAAALSKRYGWGDYKRGVPRILTSEALWKKVIRWNELAGKGMFIECVECGNREFRKWDMTLPPGGLSCCSTKGCLALPESESNPVRPRVFPSLCDPFDAEVPLDWFTKYLSLVRTTLNIDHLLLTKRPELWQERLTAALTLSRTPGSFFDVELADFIESWLCGVAPKNVWMIASTENQDMANKRIPELLEIPAIVHGLSIEPLIGPIDLSTMWKPIMEGIDWVIIGGESGPGARVCRVEWIEVLIKQCAAMAVNVFVKQMGAKPVESDTLGHDGPVDRVIKLEDPKGGDITAWPKELQIREFPNT